MERAGVRRPAPIRRPLEHCPGCGSDQLDPIVALEIEDVHFLCAVCSRCWHVELGYVHRVAPTSCIACPTPARCAQVYEADRTPSSPATPSV